MKIKNILLVIFLMLLSFGAGMGCFWLWQNQTFVLQKLTNLSQKGGNIATPSPIVEVSPQPVLPSLNPQASLSPQPSGSPEPSLTPSILPNQFPNWISYTNQKYSFRLKYDPTWYFNSLMPGSLKDDRLVFQGDIKNKGWPNIEVNLQYITLNPFTIAQLKTYLETTYTTGQVSYLTFGKGMISGVLLYQPGSPQAYSSKNVYFIHQGKIFLISMTDVDQPDAKPIYDNFIAEFELL